MYYLGFDIGSSSVKVALVDAASGEKKKHRNVWKNEQTFDVCFLIFP